MSDDRKQGCFAELITAKEAENLVKRAIGNEAEIIDYTVRPYSEEKIGFLGSHQRLIVTIKNNKDNEDGLLSTMNFFVKALPYDVPTQADYIREKGVFHQEATFYGEVVPELDRGFYGEPWSAQCYLIKNDCLVFEELGEKGFEMSGKLLNVDQVRAGLGALARLHAASLHAETRLGRRLNEIYPTAFEERAFVRKGNQYRWYLAGVDVVVKIAEKLNLDTRKIPEACNKVFEAMKPSVNKQNVASHGDLWSNNLLFDKFQSNRCRLVDFQLARYSPLGHDVAQFLYLCSSRKFRDDHATTMLRHYYDCLRDCLENNVEMSIKIPPWRDVQDSYEEQKLAALVTAAIYFPTVLLDGVLAARIMNNPESYKQFVLTDRRDIVLNNMERDAQYRTRLDESVAELVEYSMKLDEMPKPC